MFFLRIVSRIGRRAYFPIGLRFEISTVILSILRRSLYELYRILCERAYVALCDFLMATMGSIALDVNDDSFVYRGALL